MMCRSPFVKLANGKVRKLGLPVTEDVVNAMTPFPCGQCFDCRLQMQKKWVSRLFLESMQHDDMCWVTLTYEKDPKNLDKKECQKFIKRLRKHFPAKSVRYFLVGEYGEKSTKRPHYHVILFGIPEEDSPTIKKCWKHGFIKVGNVTPASIKYTTKYAMKNLTQKDDPMLEGRKPEFKLASSGIGLKTLEEYGEKLGPYKDMMGVVNYLNDGKRKLFLDRHAKKKMNESIGLEDELELQKQNYRWEIFAAHYDASGETLYIDNIINEEAVRREQRETNITKTFRKKRRL